MFLCQTSLIAFYIFSLLCHDSLFLHLLCNDLGSWCTSDLVELYRFEPSLELNHLLFNLSRANPVIIDSQSKAASNLLVVLLSVNSGLIAMIVAIEAVFKSEGVHDAELFPNYYSGCPKFAALDSKSAIRQTYKWRASS